MARNVTAWEIGEQSANKPLGKFGCKVDRTIQPLEPIRVSPVKLSDNFPHASAAPSPAARNPVPAFEAGRDGTGDRA
jgi:hypothetical protein